jgi:hypothetical protein
MENIKAPGSSFPRTARDTVGERHTPCAVAIPMPEVFSRITGARL